MPRLGHWNGAPAVLPIHLPFPFSDTPLPRQKIAKGKETLPYSFSSLMSGHPKCRQASNWGQGEIRMSATRRVSRGIWFLPSAHQPTAACKPTTGRGLPRAAPTDRLLRAGSGISTKLKWPPPLLWTGSFPEPSVAVWRGSDLDGHHLQSRASNGGRAVCLLFRGW